MKCRRSQNCKWKIVGAGLDADCVYRSVIPTWPLADPTGVIPGSHGGNYWVVLCGQRSALNDRSKKWCWKSPPHAPNVMKIKLQVLWFWFFNRKGGDNYILHLCIIKVGVFFFILVKRIPPQLHTVSKPLITQPNSERTNRLCKLPCRLGPPQPAINIPYSHKNKHEGSSGMQVFLRFI